MGRPQRTTAAKRQELDDSSKDYDENTQENTQANDQSSADSMSPLPRQGDTPADVESADPAQREDDEESDPAMEFSNPLVTATVSDNSVAATSAPNMGKGASRNSKSKGKGKAPKG